MFGKDMRFKRMIAIIIMAGVGLFFCIYSIGFCGIYIHTQITWLYSCVWILFFNWIVFAPFTVLVMTGAQYCYRWNECDYYIKNIFPF